MVRLALICLLGLAFVLALRSPASSDSGPAFQVIVHPANGADRLDKRFVADAFLRKRTRWGDDRAIMPVDLVQKSSARSAFSHAVLGRDVVSVRRYWAQLMFSGRGVPPPELPSDGDVIKYVAAHSGAIGYVAPGAALSGVKVVEVE
jgi:ABC-type phosphate transport system substrate-binding protein